MIEDMINVMKRINEIKGRFGMMRHNPSEPAKKSDADFGVMVDDAIGIDKTHTAKKVSGTESIAKSAMSAVLSDGKNLNMAINAIKSGIDPSDDGSDLSLKNSAAKELVSRVLESYTKNR